MDQAAPTWLVDGSGDATAVYLGAGETSSHLTNNDSRVLFCLFLAQTKSRSAKSPTWFPASPSV